MEVDNHTLQIRNDPHHHKVDTAINLTIISSPRFRLLWSIKNFSALEIECGASLSVNFDWEYRNTKWSVNLFPNGQRSNQSSAIIGFITILEIGDKSDNCVRLRCKMGIVNQDCEYIKVSLRDVTFKPIPKRVNTTFAAFELIDRKSIFDNENIYLKNDELLLSVELIVPTYIGKNIHHLVYSKNMVEHLLYAVRSKALLKVYKNQDLPPSLSDQDYQQLVRISAYAGFFKFSSMELELPLRTIVDSLSLDERKILEMELQILIEKYSNYRRSRYVMHLRD